MLERMGDASIQCHKSGSDNSLHLYVWCVLCLLDKLSAGSWKKLERSVKKLVLLDTTPGSKRNCMMD